MNEELQRHIADAVRILKLSKVEAHYLKSCMMLAYHYGEQDQLKEDYQTSKKIINGIK
ncbi:MAG TPA: hypothetical protein VF941_03075 [Clostridia bacterium]